MKNNIHFIITGGTLDKIYDPVLQTTDMAKESILPLYIKNAINPKLHTVSYETIALIDSRDMTDKIREKILKSVIAAKAGQVIITHGTDTMSITAEYLKNKLPPVHGKRVVLTGSMIPLREFSLSDGGFNIGFAMGAAQQLPAGVFMAMHAQIFPAGKALKNLKTARFEFKDL